ncbi:FkbM family methyltransferase [Bradyrhizobium liaoningense]|uniref:FkbM family methyltransferase n=1 Tax=Bradyrhizobium liaoningense TaxID=43992 RepID=UPI001BAC2A13|nr:FkbM family methyltransferase [Bradyrhizobium liaoningense]MBR0906453.1 FkbM family methyltransferase [Bradyrhizobium liaoningense]
MQPESRGFVFSKLYDNRISAPLKCSIVRSIARRNGSRAMLNHYYGLLDDRAKSRFHARYAKIFRDQSGDRLATGDWTVHFDGKAIRLPLRSSSLWLDWDSAVSIVGHDVEIKQTYAELVKSDERPALFLDVGANYGTHSVLFLSAGIPTISFEPNSSCFSYFQTVCELNRLEGWRWEQVAVGDRSGQVELVYPEHDTWLGSVSLDVMSSVKSSGKVITKQVPLRRIDDYLDDIGRDKILMKIDVEGFEREVIQGASQLLTRYGPKIIFESNTAESRGEFIRLLSSFGYSVYPLPYRPSAGHVALRPEAFLASAATNFIAIAG